ncbi:hypothetical protein SDC9_07489 [bioreactor metagenome]|uniref:DUF2953 domain-containing protein n=1 Tax=bioreactor metagenome TaxID=1076179 RepID=A0A644T4X5_9ZZZZ|nr:DUF2953 domain-containing protein [Methanobrevibacter sp.]MEA4956943.1 DUF2953 domain-containing protein [Methanobrevibacter sp.]
MIIEIIVGLIIFIIILILIFLYFGLNINIFLNKRGNDFKGQIEVKFSIFKIFSKNFPDDEKNKKPENDKKENIKRKSNDIKDKNSSEDLDDELNKNNSAKDKDNVKDKNSKNKLNEFRELFPLISTNFWDILDLIESLLYSVNLKKFKLHLILGFSSPVNTATTLGYIWAFSATPNLSKSFNLSAEPIFNKEIFDFESEIVFKISLLKPVLKIFKLLTKKSMIKLILKLRKFFK